MCFGIIKILSGKLALKSYKICKHSPNLLHYFRSCMESNNHSNQLGQASDNFSEIERTQTLL